MVTVYFFFLFGKWVSSILFHIFEKKVFIYGDRHFFFHDVSFFISDMPWTQHTLWDYMNIPYTVCLSSVHSNNTTTQLAQKKLKSVSCVCFYLYVDRPSVQGTGKRTTGGMTCFYSHSNTNVWRHFPYLFNPLIKNK